METKVAARWARRSAVLLCVAGVSATFGVSGASALPGIGRAGPAAHPRAHREPRLCQPPAVGRGPVLRARDPARQAGRTSAHGRPDRVGPGPIQSAYKLTGLNASGRTVAIVDAYDDPNASRRPRHVYRRPTACRRARRPTAASRRSTRTAPPARCPSGDYGWAEEEQPRPRHGLGRLPRLPHPARGGQLGNHTPASPRRRTARPRRPASAHLQQLRRRRRHPRRPPTDSAYNHPGIAITVSSGDSGYGVEYPAASRYVTAVGGTTLTPGVQHPRLDGDRLVGRGQRLLGVRGQAVLADDTGCAKRTVADVSADADPNTGLGVYDTYNNCGSSSSCDC